MTKKNKLVYRIIELIIVIVILISSFRIYSYYRVNMEYKKNNEEIKNYLNSEEKSKDVLNQVTSEDIKKLKQKYKSIVGWIKIDNTNIDYPFVKGRDNEYYLYHNYKGDKSPFGSVFMDKNNNEDFKDKNTILYGHNVKSGKVFNTLIEYKNEEFANNNSIIEISTDSSFYRYMVFSSYYAKPDENFRSVKYNDEEWSKFVNRINDRNIIKSGFSWENGYILTLQTCFDDNDRFVVHCVRINEQNEVIPYE